jgi:lysophospholipase L1-like esterase
MTRLAQGAGRRRFGIVGAGHVAPRGGAALRRGPRAIAGGVLLVLALVNGGPFGCSRSAPVDCGDCARQFGGHRVVACLGDSNTHQPEQAGWCELLAQQDGSLRFLNYGFPGGVVVPSTPRFAVLDGAYWLDRALALAPPSLVIMAFGTNDLRSGKTPAEVVEGYRKLKQRSEQAGARVLIALTPPMKPKTIDKSAEVLELNELLREAFPGETVDFFTGFDLATDLTPDGIHFTEAGHRKRAAAVSEAMARRPL